MRPDWLWIGQVAMASLVNVAYAFAVGSALHAAWLEQVGRSPVAPAHAAWLRAQRSLQAAALMLVLALAGWLVYESASMSGEPLPDAFDVVSTVLTQTHVGMAWSVAFGGALVLLGTVFVATGAVRDGVLWLALIVVALGHAALGHAADAGFASAALGVQALHLLSTAAWGGVVMAGGLAVLPALGASTARGVLIRTSGQVSSVAFFAVGFMLATGLFNAVRGTGGSWAGLTESVWGHLLIVKIALVVVALAMGAYNRMAVMGQLRRTASTAAARRFVNVIHLEAIVMIGIFVVAAVLARSVPG